jgi:hypothetical protein
MIFYEKHMNTIVSSVFVLSQRPRVSKRVSKWVSGYSYLSLDKSKLKHTVLNAGILLKHNYMPDRLYHNLHTQVHVYKKDDISLVG